MLSFSSVEDVILFQGVNVIIFEGLDVIIFEALGVIFLCCGIIFRVLSFMLSFGVIIFVLSFFLVQDGCYQLCYHLMLSFFVIISPLFSFS
jgi:hypothetical protein